MTRKTYCGNLLWQSGLTLLAPAVSESTGSVPTFESQSKFVNLNSSGYKNGWGRSGNPYNDQWLHSDMKDMAYYYVYRLYDELVQKIQGGAQ